MRTALSLCVALVLANAAAADDEPFAARTGPPRCREHTHERAGTTGTARFAAPSVSCKEAGGYVGGNRIRATPGTACAPNPGVFGWDWVGHAKMPNRIFLGFGPDRPHQQPFQPKYDTDPKR